MSRKYNALTVAQVKNAKPQEKDFKLYDGRGMFLLVKTNGSKYWRAKVRYAGKETQVALGVYPDVSLAEARQALETARKQAGADKNPNLIKKQDRLKLRDAEANSFYSVALEWFDNQLHNKSESHRSRTMRLMKNDLFPAIGRRAINDISAPELLMALRKIEARGSVDMAYRARQTAGQVFRYAIATGRAERDLSADLKGALKARTKGHYAAITDPKEAGKLMVAIEGFSGTPAVRGALRLSPLVFTRPKDVRRMEWSEIDWDQRRWIIPAAKRTKKKAEQDHIVPLSTQALEVLRDMEPVTGHWQYVFPNARSPRRPLSNNGVRTALRTLGYDNNTMTPHGFRAMARTILDEVLGFRPDYIEHQLAHAVKDPNGRAYNRTSHLPARTKMMQVWADYLDSLKVEAAGGNIVLGHFKQSS